MAEPASRARLLRRAQGCGARRMGHGINPVSVFMASRAIHLIVVALGLAGAGAAAWWLQKPASAPAQGASAAAAADAAKGKAPPVAVEAVAVRTMVLSDEAQAVGSLRSRRTVMLRPEVSGRVTQLNFRDGARVRKGQLLVQFDDQLPRAQVQQAQAELSIARANHQRNQELVAQGFVSQRSLDESAANLQVAQAKLALAEATAQRLKITAPFEGVAGIRNVNEGDFLKDGTDIVHIEDLDSVFVDFRLPERYQGKLRVGQTARVELDALPGEEHRAMVLAVDPLIDANGRSVSVRASIDNPQLRLRPGMFARVTVRFGERADALVVPEEAIVPQGNSPYVLQVVPGEAGDTTVRRAAVRLGLRREGMVEVQEGLRLGDTVVTAGQQRVARDGVPVRVTPPPAAADAASAAPRQPG